MMTTTFTIRLSEKAGEPMLDSAGMALMFGVTTTDVDHLPFKDGAAVIPREWIRRGRRRTREAAARIGSNEFADVLGYWAHKDYGAALRLVYQ